MNSTDNEIRVAAPIPDTQQTIYRILRKSFMLCHASACGIMANICAESAYDSEALQKTFEKRFGFGGREYTRMIDTGAISMDEFIHDGAGYGLCQWTFYSRKELLYRFMKERGCSIGFLPGQMEFLKYELESDFPEVLEVLRGESRGELRLKKKEIFGIYIQDNEQGAYDAAYYYCGAFERPGNNEGGERCHDRGELARALYNRFKE